MSPVIVFEGLDGAGKSTLARAVGDRLDAVMLRTPGPEFSDFRARLDLLMDDHPRARQLLYAATVALCSDQARLAVNHGRAVVIDRYLASTQVYAGLRGTPLSLLEFARDLVKPDLTVFVVCEDEVRRQRMAARGVFTAEDERSLQSAAALRSAYLKELDGEVLVLDSTNEGVGSLTERVLARLHAPANPSLWR